MRIKTSDGEVNVTPQGQGTLNTVLGAVGTAAALGMGRNILGLGDNNRPPRDPEDRPVTRYEMRLIREAIEKDNEITLLKSQRYTDRAIDGVNKAIGEQIAWNAVQGNNIKMLQYQLGQITKFTVPESAISVPVVPPTVSQGTTTQTQQGGGQ